MARSLGQSQRQIVSKVQLDTEKSVLVQVQGLRAEHEAAMAALRREQELATERLKESHAAKVASLKEKVRVLTEERDSRSESRDVLREELQVKLAAQEKLC